ncbi:MAG: toprim domain-containing protein, partial [Anaerolineaceae bacterium]|nr:toprim domain-containing protein [Anaerolineaceae bacterium]
MGRYPDHVIEKIKREIDLPALFRAKGAELKPTHNGGFECLCLFHQENTASLKLNRVDGIWVAHCFGCDWSGDGIKFFMDTEGVSFVHAIELLSNGHGHQFMMSDRVVKKSTVPRLPSPVELTAQDHEALTQVLGYYHERLKLTVSALEYLKSRKIGSEEAINHHYMGFSDRTLGLRLPESNRKAGAEIRERLKRLGIYRDNGREHFRGCLVFPIRDENGIITEIYGRAIGKLRAGTPKHLYLPGPHQGIWNPKALHGEELILTECIIDALSFWDHGFRNVISLYGVSGLTNELFQAIVHSPVKVIRLAYDHDEPGNKNAQHHAESFLKEGKDCFRIVFPRGMDANEYIQKVDNPSESLRHLINSAVWLGKGTSVSTTASPDQSTLTAEERPLPAGREKVPPAEPTQAPPGASPRREPSGVGSVDAKVSWDKVEIDFEDRHYRIFGLHKNMSFGVLRVNMRLMVDDLYYDDEINLYK